jgi:hypothetical protein
MALFAMATFACENERPRPVLTVTPPSSGVHIEELSPSELAAQEPAPPLAAPSTTELSTERQPWVVERAPASDADYSTDEPVETRRYVYRVHLAVPETLGANRSDLAIPAAELFIDVTDERLRARFVGPGWPVEAGSEIRLRGDSPGIYVFDRGGGRSLAPGLMSEWFEGGPRDRAGPLASVRRDPLPAQKEVPGALMCALLAEWTGEPREHFMRRCDRAAPLAFRVGFWRAERTADVPVELPRRAIRADEVGPPQPIVATSSRAFLEPAALARLPPMERPPRESSAAPSDVPEGLEFVNDSESRVVVTVEGVAVGHVDAGARGLFIGFLPGHYRVAALRPMGAVISRPRAVRVPGRMVLRAR